MRSILVLNAKGGSGKTTVATNLAGYYASEGAKVALADFDPQGSSIDWVAQRSDKFPKIAPVESFRKGARIPRNAEIVIMDAPSRTHGDQLLTLLRKAQTVVLPVVPSPVDIRAAQRFFWRNPGSSRPDQNRRKARHGREPRTRRCAGDQ